MALETPFQSDRLVQPWFMYQLHKHKLRTGFGRPALNACICRPTLQAGSNGPNCGVQVGTSELELLFVTDQDLEAGSEIFIDYGRSYDRSAYRG